LRHIFLETVRIKNARKDFMKLFFSNHILTNNKINNLKGFLIFIKEKVMPFISSIAILAKKIIKKAKKSIRIW
jgi:hypothetical protein